MPLQANNIWYPYTRFSPGLLFKSADCSKLILSIIIGKKEYKSMNQNNLTRRDFLKGTLAAMGGGIVFQFSRALSSLKHLGILQSKRIYIAPDDHTDYFWKAGENTYRQAFIDMIDYYLDLADTTAGNPSEHQSRWNCDGSFWLWIYEKNKSTADYQRLINRIRDGHISFPLNALVLCSGGAPAEAVIRGMYYAGKVERRENIRFPMAIAMENQTLPYGLGSLWAGAGAKYSWKGICNCDTRVPAAWDREHEIYWCEGLDGNRILMKWNSMLVSNQSMGGYAEARNPAMVVNYVDSDPNFNARYPYDIIGAFGKGWDDLQTMTDEFVKTAKDLTNNDRLVIVSNEEDFFEDFENTYGASLATVSSSFGNEWDLYCAALAEVSANVKRSVEKLRSAEALATLVTLKNQMFMDGRTEARDLAWMDLGLFWEHNFGMVSPPSGLVQQRIDWQKRLASEIESYVNNLETDSILALGGLILRTGSNKRFFAFNSLSWVRTDYADFPYEGSLPVHVIDISIGLETPSQIITIDSNQYLRILAEDIPAVGYKVFEVVPGAGQSFSDAALGTGKVIENQFYQVTIADRGAITSWVDKTRNNREFAQSINGRLINDLGDSTGTFVVENAGPVTVTMLATASNPLDHTTRISFIRNSNRIEIRNDINQNFDSIHTWGFGFGLSNPEVWHEEVGAVIKAKLISQGGHYSDRSENSRYDWLTLNHFVDINEGQVGITLSNSDCYFMKLGNSTISTLDISTPQVSVLAGGKVANGNNGLPGQGGDTHFLQRFALQTHGAYDQVAAMKFALEHQNPFVTGEVTGGNVYPETLYSLVSIDNPNVLVWALKPADDGIDQGVIVRVWNLSSVPESFNLSMTQGTILTAKRATHIETPIEDAVIRNGALSETIAQHQIKTFLISLNQQEPLPTPTQTPDPPVDKKYIYLPLIKLNIPIPW